MAMKDTHRVVLLTMLIAGFAWMCDAFVDSYILHQGRFLDTLFFTITPLKLYMRSIFSGFIILAGLIIAHVITTRNRLVRVTEDSENRFRTLIDSTDDSIYLVNRDCAYLYMNRKHREWLGIPEGGFKGRNYSEFHPPLESEIFSKRINTVFSTGKSHQYEYKSPLNNKYYLQTFSPVKDSDGNITAVTIISKKIDSLKEVEKRLRTLSFTDELTDLYNRRGFFTAAEQQIKLAHRQSNRLVLIASDLDYLKRINDTYGHQEGDEALKETAKILQKTFRGSDIIARIGGDEFVVLAAETPETDFSKLISRLRTNMDIFNITAKKQYDISISAGVAYYHPDYPCSIDELLSRADTLMYAEKKNKKLTD